MIKDVFNNSADNYLKTGISPCEGTGGNIFQFFPKKEAGISSGNKILQSINLGDIQIEVSSWEQNKKILGPGEVNYIAGLTKELQNKSQYFNIGYDVPDSSLGYMSISLSIDYYNNFKFYSVSLSAISDPSTGIDIISAINTQFTNQSINVQCAIDASVLSIIGKTPGYNFTVENNVTLANFDQSMNNTSSFNAPELLNNSIPYAKYINGAMLGIILIPSYPSDEVTYDKWLYINHVKNTFGYYDFDDDTYYVKNVDTGSSTTSTATSICGGDYLSYITDNNLWDKIGYMYSKINTFDQSNSAQDNLVTGFYIFNPHDFAVEIDYMMIN